MPHVPGGPIDIGQSAGLPEEPSEKEPGSDIGRCKRCGKKSELVDGLCTECKSEIDAGLQHPTQKEKKHHFWSHDKTDSEPTTPQSENESGTNPDE